MLIKGVSRSKPRGRSVERRPVNRPLSANEHAFQDRTIEVDKRVKRQWFRSKPESQRRWSLTKTSNNGTKRSQTPCAGRKLKSKTSAYRKRCHCASPLRIVRS